MNTTHKSEKIATLLLDGMSNKEMAEILFISEQTVKYHY